MQKNCGIIYPIPKVEHKYILNKNFFKPMLKKYLAAGLIFSSILISVPAFATDLPNASSTPEQRILEAKAKLEARFAEAKQKLEERLTKLQTRQAKNNAAIACVAIAVNTREAAIGQSFTAYATAQSAALSTRATALNAAWGAVSTTPEAVRKAVNAAWSTYKDAHKAAVKTHNAATAAAWNTFRAAANTCRAGSTVSVDSRSSGTDSVQ